LLKVFSDKKVLLSMTGYNGLSTYTLIPAVSLVFALDGNLVSEIVY